MPPVFRFGEYTLRPTGARDRELLEQFIAADPFHAGKVEADFFLRAEPGEEVWALEDGGGRVVFYFKTQVACRAHIQFGPAGSAADRERNRTALLHGFAWLVAQLQANSFGELLFDSENPLLRATAKRRMGFEDAPHDVRRILRSTTPMSMAGHQVSGATEGRVG